MELQTYLYFGEDPGSKPNEEFAMHCEGQGTIFLISCGYMQAEE